jgi:hypothetical protein
MSRRPAPIEIVSSNQAPATKKSLPFSNFRETRNHPNLYGQWGFEKNCVQRLFLCLTAGMHD